MENHIYRTLLVFSDLQETGEHSSYRVAGRIWITGDSEILMKDRLCYGVENLFIDGHDKVEFDIMIEDDRVIWMSGWNLEPEGGWKRILDDLELRLPTGKSIVRSGELSICDSDRHPSLLVPYA